MKKLFAATLTALFICSCDRSVKPEQAPFGPFKIETLNKFTPVKNQGGSSFCWIYAMLATIESDRLMLGDSVNLSPHYLARMMLREQLTAAYLSKGRDSMRTAATAPFTLKLIERYGVMPYDAYRSECNYTVLSRRLNLLAKQSAALCTGLQTLDRKADTMLDEAVGPLPFRVYMLGAEYTTEEFAHSICMPGDYEALTSFTHEPFNKRIRLDVPDNRSDGLFMNLPIDSLMNRITTALLSGRSVCWEGDVTEPGFSFKEGVARLQTAETDLSPQVRQRMFESFRTTDDHCMELIGLARDQAGHRYFICKNSWGTSNPYHGLMFMSFEYARMKTIAVVMKRSDR